ncbi:MAG: hypothetical protein WCI05_04130 [Myxococcales bacterium]|jgi:hypothetical protein
MSLSRPVVVFFPLLLALWLSCSNYAEGERCDIASDDCQAGLVCTRASDLNKPRTADNQGFCCPSDRTRATTQMCALPLGPIGGDAGLPPSDSASAIEAAAADAPDGD